MAHYLDEYNTTKKIYDKRADIKKKEVDKQLRRDFKSKLSI